MNNLVAYAQKYPEKRLKLFVVSDIKSKAAFFRRLKKPENFSLIFKGKMFGEELEKFLRKSVDIVLAMGVSCLEGAKLRLVSISAPASNKKIPVSVPVTLISDFCKYSTGGYWKKDNGYLKRYAFSDLIDTVTENYDHYADACYQYVKDNFQIDTIMPFFLRFLDKTQLSLDDMELKKWK